MSAAVVTLLFIVAGLLVAAIGTACHAWSMAVKASEDVFRMERLLRTRETKDLRDARRAEIAAAEAEVAAWWQGYQRGA